MSSRSMRAVAVVPTKQEIRLVEHPTPGLSADTQIKVRSLDVGVCGTDKEICTFVYGSPPAGDEYLVLGHESLGEVVEVGSRVSRFKAGDLVVPSVRRPCPHTSCQPCRADFQDFCNTGDFTERGIKEVHGYMTEYYVDDERFFTVVPPELRDVAVLVEPLTVAEKALAQIWRVQQRFPRAHNAAPEEIRGEGLNAVVLGAGPVGILGAMALVARGFNTYVYSRSEAPNPKADLVEAIGAPYISAKKKTAEQLAERVGNIDVVYEAVGTARISFQVLKNLGTNGIFVFTGIPAPRPAIDVEADMIMRNVVLKNQAVVGTVNADGAAFEAAIRDLQVFNKRWPDTLRGIITGRHTADSYRELLLGDKTGIKNVISFA